MNRDYWVGKVSGMRKLELLTQVAFHEAGHAVAIYLRNRALDLPQMNFRISLTGFGQSIRDAESPADERWYAKLEGGLLAERQLAAAKACLSLREADVYRQACEADVVNLMVGPMAEAKHVAQRDGEAFNPLLVNYEALKNYGGNSDQEKIEAYLEQFEMPLQRKTEKLNELHAVSYDFVNQGRHWFAISRLANYILTSENSVIASDEAIAVVEAAVNVSRGFCRNNAVLAPA